MTISDRWEARDIARVAVFAAIIVVLGLMGPIPVPGLVPITAQTLGIMLAGAILGWKRGGAAVLVFLLLVAIGLPVLSGGRGGLGVFVGPSAGYLIAFVPAAIVVGLIAHSGRLTWWRVGLGTVVGGLFVMYALGIPVAAAVTGQPLSLTALQALAFVPGDLIKAVLATLLTLALFRAYPPAFPAKARAFRAGTVDTATASASA
ncbi:biotin transporter BioY [Microbacterium amylolyticum]|uniref:Biotin transporter n=1 Tax=Microbacterium amylolyticum TaxID=936337 RepID=A0ABS4ZDQ0_9MICO|nr:biotin transporter BioY [Microbacterium amylolyticum]MBP2435424.1 biotin transport system substrate-specific component [Microbacterium amylolyticum]